MVLANIISQISIIVPSGLINQLPMPHQILPEGDMLYYWGFSVTKRTKIAGLSVKYPTSNGVGSRGPLKGHWRSPGAEPRWGSRVPGGHSHMKVTYECHQAPQMLGSFGDTLRQKRGFFSTKRTKIAGFQWSASKKYGLSGPKISQHFVKFVKIF